MDKVHDDIESFVASWSPCAAKDAFMSFRKTLESLPGVTLTFKARPGITYSLRGTHQAQSTRELFTLIDVIDDDPEERWLSVCFYDDLVTDPEELGDWVPQGLLGEDARCFNVDEADEDMLAYVTQRILEAGSAAGQ
ncbi:hypothetical protein MASR1M90_11310 [Desulfovibrionales bacterium]